MVDAPIGKLPLFIKKNTILPWGKEVSHISGEPDESMTFRLFGKKGKYVHYQDNGTDFKYQKGEYNLYKVKVDKDGSVKVKLEKHGFGPVYRRITVQLPNKKIEFKYKNGEYVRE